MSTKMRTAVALAGVSLIASVASALGATTAAAADSIPITHTVDVSSPVLSMDLPKSFCFLGHCIAY